ncbi:MAG: hypothetical protein LQ342_002691 [Letrouitia transgressa]|nr:MAG: hypothetical protein LQ342_002691 [Letrouitia transgressa]
MAKRLWQANNVDLIPSKLGASFEPLPRNYEHSGGGAYYLAKRSINADRKARHDAELMRQRAAYESLNNAARDTPPKQRQRKIRYSGDTTAEANQDTQESSEIPDQDKPKYQATKLYRTKRGDRLT